MPDPKTAFGDPFARLDDAEVVFVAQDGHALAPSRVRCYSFAKALERRGIRAEVLSFFDHLAAPDQGGPVLGMSEAEKLRFAVAGYEALSRNPRAVLYVQKTGYHIPAVALAATCNGNRIVLDYDDYDLDSRPYRNLESWLPSLAPDRLLATTARHAEACVVSSRRILDFVAPLNPNTHLIHTVADLELFNPGDRDRPRTRFGDAVNILWCGDVWGDVPMRDILFAVDAFASMPSGVRAQACFHIIGFGRAWEELKRRIRTRYPDLSGIALHERIAPAEFGAVLAEMDIGVLPYADNAFNASKSPTKMFEFLLAKVAVCATPVGEVAHCLEDGRSVVLAQGLERYSDALARLVADAAFRHRIADAAHRIGMERYTLDGIGDRLAGILRAAASPRSTGTSGQALAPFLEKVLGRRLAIAPREVQLARNDLHALAGMDDPAAAEPRRWSAPLLAMLDWHGLETAEGIAAERARELKTDGLALRNAARLRPELALPPAGRPPGPPRLCKLAAAEDWEDESWWNWFRRFKTDYASFPLDADGGRIVDEDGLNQLYSYFKRSRGVWERVQYLYGLDRLGLLDGAARVLVAGRAPDDFPLFLTGHAARVEVVDLGERAAGYAARVAGGQLDLWLSQPQHFHRNRLAVHHGGLADVPEDAAWDAVVAMQGAAFLPGLPDFLAWADARLRTGGVLALATEIRLNAQGPDNGTAGIVGWPVSMLGGDGPDEKGLGDGFAALLARHTGLEVLGPVDASFSDATLDRLIITGAPDAANPHFVARTGADLHATAVWFCRKTAATPAAGWHRLAEALPRQPMAEAHQSAAAASSS